jgi:hypothetical protein
MTESTRSTAPASHHAHVRFAQPPQVVFDALASLGGLAGW